MPTMRTILRVFCFALFCAVTLSSVAEAKERKAVDAATVEKIRTANAECLSCHSEEGLSAGKHPDVKPESLKGLMVDPHAFLGSNHANVECLSCHVVGFKEFPHAEKSVQEINNCDECHTRAFLRIEDQFLESVHAQKLPDKFTCVTCHDPHIFKRASWHENVRDAVHQDNAMCLGCHDAKETFAEWSKEPLPDLAKIHDWLPNIQNHWDSVRCVECHTPIPKKVLSHQIVAADKAQKNCVECHSVDSELRVRLYRHLVGEERERLGFFNSVIMNEAYVIGATRNRFLDLASFILLGLVGGGIAVHGSIRLIAAWLRRRRHG